ncbi:MAG: hypothetical protein HUJ25_14190 [Crocinitomicaceae bacterium]|nr:hypothetical protein [Crocinitomicaceae bacterium]
MFPVTSCQTSFGEKYTRGNLEIYYTEEMQSYVEPVADYFEQNNLIFEHTHSIMLTSSKLGDGEGSLILKMVANKDKDIPSDERKTNITLLEQDLKKEVFGNASFRIAVCDENFVELKSEE